MMLTKCPGCETAFRVSAEQLKVKQGKVRCGQCRQVFNALESLVDEPTATVVEAHAPVDTTVIAAEAAVVETAPEDMPPVAGDAASPAAAESEVTAPWPSYLDDAAIAPAYSRRHRLAAWLWGGAAFIAALLLALQALLQFRTELSQSFPAATSFMRNSYALFGVDLPLPRKADLLGIETSDLHPGSGAQLVLAATLKNRAPFAQAYPNLELTLTDVGDQALLRRVLAPAEYLPTTIDTAAGFAANGELALNLVLEADVIGAAGYRIYLFYP